MGKFRIPLVVTFNRNLDCDSELEVFTPDGHRSNYLSKEKASELVDHLIEVFGLKYKKEEPSEK